MRLELVELSLTTSHPPLSLQRDRGSFLDQFGFDFFGRLAGPTHIYPTLSEINRRVAIDHLAESFFSDRTRRILRLLFRYRGAAG